MTTRKYGYFPMIFFFALVLNLACVGLQKTYPERRYYDFNVKRSGKNDASPKPSVVEIRNFRVSPAYHGNEFVYRVAADSYESDFYNQFLKSPSLLLTQRVFEWFSQANVFRYVVLAPSQVPGDYILNGYINGISGDYRESGSPKAVLAAQVFLLKDESGKDTIVFSRSYEREIGLASRSPMDLVNGWNEALYQILTELEMDLRQLNLEASQ